MVPFVSLNFPFFTFILINNLFLFVLFTFIFLFSSPLKFSFSGLWRNFEDLPPCPQPFRRNKFLPGVVTGRETLNPFSPGCSSLSAHPQPWSPTPLGCGASPRMQQVPGVRAAVRDMDRAPALPRDRP